MPGTGIWSDGDAYLTEQQIRTSGERIKGSFQYQKITGASHWMNADKPNELNRLLSRSSSARLNCFPSCALGLPLTASTGP